MNEESGEWEKKRTYACRGVMHEGVMFTPRSCLLVSAADLPDSRMVKE